MSNCTKCGRVLYIGKSKCLCGWKASAEDVAIARCCHFAADGKCKGKVSVRINDSWLCNWHYENFYDHKLRTGEIIPA